MAEKQAGEKLVAANRKAFHDYFILEKLEAGISLLGTEVKAIREGRLNLTDSYAMIQAGEAFLFNCHISPYSHGNRENHDPDSIQKASAARERNPKADRENAGKGTDSRPVACVSEAGKSESGDRGGEGQEADRQA